MRTALRSRQRVSSSRRRAWREGADLGEFVLHRALRPPVKGSESGEIPLVRRDAVGHLEELVGEFVGERVALGLLARESALQPARDRPGARLGVAKSVGDAMGGAGILETAGIPPPRAAMPPGLSQMPKRSSRPTSARRLRRAASSGSLGPIGSARARIGSAPMRAIGLRGQAHEDAVEPARAQARAVDPATALVGDAARLPQGVAPKRGAGAPGDGGLPAVRPDHDAGARGLQATVGLAKDAAHHPAPAVGEAVREAPMPVALGPGLPG